MKNLLMIGLLIAGGAAGSAHAQVTQVSGEKYHEYLVELTADSKEEKSITLQVNAELEVVAMGDPEIPGHGHYDYNVTGSVIEGGKTCNFDVLLTQGSGERQTTAQILKSGADRSERITLCSGLSIIVSARTLINGGAVLVSLYAPGLSKPIGHGKVIPNGLKTVPESDIDWDRH